MGKAIGLLLLLGLVYYGLYRSGYLVVNAKTAAMFVGSIGGNGRCKARFSACNGYVKRVVKFKESRPYQFVLDSDLTKGALTVELLDGAKHNVFTLDEQHPSDTVAAERKKRYYLVLRFAAASGSYELRWD